VNPQRTAAVFRMHGYDVLRRRTVLGLLLSLPMLLYAAIPDDPARPGFAVVLVGTLMTFSIAGPSIFVMLGGRDIDQRLGLVGFKPLELLGGRFALLSLLGISTSVIFAAVVMIFDNPRRPAYLMVGLVLMALLSVALGLACGATLPGDLEAMLVMIGFVGVQLVAGPSSAIHKLLPFRAPILLLYMASGRRYSLSQVLIPGVWWIVFFTFVAYATIRRRSPQANG
jgi:hypothetical protein